MCVSVVPNTVSKQENVFVIKFSHSLSLVRFLPSNNGNDFFSPYDYPLRHVVEAVYVFSSYALKDAWIPHHISWWQSILSWRNTPIQHCGQTTATVTTATAAATITFIPPFFVSLSAFRIIFVNDGSKERAWIYSINLSYNCIYFPLRREKKHFALEKDVQIWSGTMYPMYDRAILEKCQSHSISMFLDHLPHTAVTFRSIQLNISWTFF